MANKVFIATSLDGYIADKNNSIDWLSEYPAPENSHDYFTEFMNNVDALIMGKNTFETVVSFGLEAWVYTKPVYVLSNSLREIPKGYEDKAFLVSGELENILEALKAKGHKDFYIDGGSVIQSFLAKDLIDEMQITIVPRLLGGGVPLFGNLETSLNFTYTKSQTLYAGLAMHYYTRERVQ